MKTCIIFGLLIALCCVPTVGQAAPYVAYSLREAQDRARAGQRDQTLLTLGGITRVIGMVQDPAGDLVLVGRAVAGEPGASLADLAQALRARLVLDSWPLVSIDPVADTARTGLQRVRFGGGIEGAFGRDFLLSDVWLKEYSLALLPERPGIASLRRLIGQGAAGAAVSHSAFDWARVTDADRTDVALEGRPVRSRQFIQARFWFTPAETRLLVRDGVFAITELRLKVAVEDMGAVGTGPNARGATGQPPNRAALAFAAGLSRQINRLRDVPAIARLKILFDLTQVAEGVRALAARPNLDWLLNELPVGRIDMASELPLIRVVGRRALEDGSTEVISLSGGVRFKSELRWLKRGDVAPLRRIVLGTRPAPDALTWTLPLAGWAMPNGSDLPPNTIAPDAGQADTVAGVAVAAETLVLAPSSGSSSAQSELFRGFRPASALPPLAPSPRLGTPDRLGGVTFELCFDLARSIRDASLDGLRDSVLRRSGGGGLIVPLPAP